ncbi:MAG: ankyrin repeat domain-containing protein [Terracidiphilus sp.]
MDDLQTLIEGAQRGAVDEVRSCAVKHPELVRRRDATGATALHFAAFGGHREVIEILLEHGAEINVTDARYGATPTGWAIEYLREAGGFLGIELADFAFAIERGDVVWVARFLKRFPRLRDASGTHGVPFRTLAQKSSNPEIIRLFEGNNALRSV